MFLGVLPLQAAGFGLLLLGLAARKETHSDDARAEQRPAWLTRAVAFVGISSYSTYLWHWPFAEVLTRTIGLGRLDAHPVGPLIRLAVFIAVALGLGAVSFRLVERPALAWRRRRLAARGVVDQPDRVTDEKRPRAEPA